MDRILALAAEKSASDITLRPQRNLALRIQKQVVMFDPITAHEFARFVVDHSIRQENHAVGAFTVDGQRYRYVFTTSLTGPVLEVRILPKTILKHTELGIPAKVLELARRPNGIILVTGPTNSGKSTTLAALIDYLNENTRGKIVTLEEPIEQIHHDKTSLIQQREFGTHFADWPAAIKTILRQDINAALIGEIRDADSLLALLTAGETGHMIFSTLHTRDAAGAITRVMDASPNKDFLAGFADSLVAVLAQQLVPTVQGGKTAAFELLLNCPSVRTAIRNNQPNALRDELRRGNGLGMITMEESLHQLLRAQRISPETALNFAFDQDFLRRKITLAA